MSNCYVGEIRMFGFGRTPINWLACDGSLVSIAEYEVLYQLLGTTYGGDGQNTFALPDLRGRLPLHQGKGNGTSTYVLGQLAGTETVTLTQQQMATHYHTVLATRNAASTGTVSAAVLPGTVSGETVYASDITGGNPFVLAPTTVSIVGGNQAHDNTMPTLTVQFCIATSGVYPTQA